MRMEHLVTDYTQFVVEIISIHFWGRINDENLEDIKAGRFDLDKQSSLLLGTRKSSLGIFLEEGAVALLTQLNQREQCHGLGDKTWCQTKNNV